MGGSPWICGRCVEPNKTDACSKCGQMRPVADTVPGGSIRGITGWTPYGHVGGGRFGLLLLILVASPLLFELANAAFSCIRHNLNR